MFKDNPFKKVRTFLKVADDESLNRHFFWKLDQCQPQPNCETQPLWVQGYPDITHLSHPSRFCHWCPSFGDNGYPPFKSTTQNQNLRPFWDFIIFAHFDSKVIKSENGLKWSAIKILDDNFLFSELFLNINFENNDIFFYPLFSVNHI